MTHASPATNALPASRPEGGRHGARRVVMLGNGMAAHRFCQEWVRRSGGPLLVLGEEKVPAYDRIHLTDLFGGKLPQALELAPAVWYAQNGIDLRLGTPVTAIDREKSEVVLQSGERIGYDVLLLATGSKARRLPIPGADLPGVHVYRTLEDLEMIRQRAEFSTRTAVLGGGLLGMEAARALCDLGLRTHLIEAASGLMTRQFGPHAAEFLQQRVQSTGIHVLTGCLTEAITRENEGFCLTFKDGRSLSVDMVVMAAGVEPRDELARACKLRTGVRGGVVVDEKLRSSDPKIYAIGECAQAHGGTTAGFAAPGFEMAAALAEHLTGGTGRYVPVEHPVRLKVMGCDAVAIGPVREEGELLTYRERGSLRQVLVQNGRIAGVALLGDATDAGMFQTAVQKRQRLWGLQRSRFLKTGRPWRKSGADEVNLWPAGAAICQCTGVTRGVLSQAVAGGCVTVEALCARTGAGTVCGSCRPLLARICGSEPAVPLPARFFRPLLWICLAVLLLAAATWVLGPLPLAGSVQALRLDTFWFDSGVKQVTGYTLLAFMLLGMALPLRKRLRRLAKLGDYTVWRLAHTLVGVFSLVALTAHTGFRLGFNLNKILMLNVLVLAVTGSFAGGVVALSHRLVPSHGRLLQNGWTLLHTLLCWPLFVLVLFHILTVYRY